MLLHVCPLAQPDNAEACNFRILEVKKRRVVTTLRVVLLGMRGNCGADRLTGMPESDGEFRPLGIC